MLVICCQIFAACLGASRLDDSCHFDDSDASALGLHWGSASASGGARGHHSWCVLADAGPCLKWQDQWSYSARAYKKCAISGQSTR